MIDVSSPEAQLIADMLEHGWSHEQACEELNRVNEANERPLVSLSAVFGVSRCLKPLVTAIKKEARFK